MLRANRRFLPGHIWHITHPYSRLLQTFQSFDRCAPDQRRLGYRLTDVAGYFKREAATVGSLLARLEAKLLREPKEKVAMDQVLNIVNL